MLVDFNTRHVKWLYDSKSTNLTGIHILNFSVSHSNSIFPYSFSLVILTYTLLDLFLSLLHAFMSSCCNYVFFRVLGVVSVDISSRSSVRQKNISTRHLLVTKVLIGTHFVIFFVTFIGVNFLIIPLKIMPPKLLGCNPALMLLCHRRNPKWNHKLLDSLLPAHPL